MRCLLYQSASDRLHNVQMGITAFLWRLPETESATARGPGAPFRAYVDSPTGRERRALRWGFEPAWVGPDGLRRIGAKPWPWISFERTPSSRVFAQPLRYQRCLVPADVLYVGEPQGVWLQAPAPGLLYLAGVWDQGTFAILTTDTPPEWQLRVGARMPVAIAPERYDDWLSLRITSARKVTTMVAARRTDWVLATCRPPVEAGYSVDATR